MSEDFGNKCMELDTAIAEEILTDKDSLAATSKLFHEVFRFYEKALQNSSFSATDSSKFCDYVGAALHFTASVAGMACHAGAVLTRSGLQVTVSARQSGIWAEEGSAPRLAMGNLASIATMCGRFVLKFNLTKELNMASESYVLAKAFEKLQTNLLGFKPCVQVARGGDTEDDHWFDTMDSKFPRNEIESMHVVVRERLQKVFQHFTTLGWGSVRASTAAGKKRKPPVREQDTEAKKPAKRPRAQGESSKRAKEPSPVGVIVEEVSYAQVHAQDLNDEASELVGNLSEDDEGRVKMTNLSIRCLEAVDECSRFSEMICGDVSDKVKRDATTVYENALDLYRRSRDELDELIKVFKCKPVVATCIPSATDVVPSSTVAANASSVGVVAVPKPGRTKQKGGRATGPKAPTMGAASKTVARAVNPLGGASKKPEEVLKPYPKNHELVTRVMSMLGAIEQCYETRTLEGCLRTYGNHLEAVEYYCKAVQESEPDTRQEFVELYHKRYGGCVNMEAQIRSLADKLSQPDTVQDLLDAAVAMQTDDVAAETAAEKEAAAQREAAAATETPSEKEAATAKAQAVATLVFQQFWQVLQQERRRKRFLKTFAADVVFRTTLAAKEIERLEERFDGLDARVQTMAAAATAARTAFEAAAAEKAVFALSDIVDVSGNADAAPMFVVDMPLGEIDKVEAPEKVDTALIPAPPVSPVTEPVAEKKGSENVVTPSPATVPVLGRGAARDRKKPARFRI